MAACVPKYQLDSDLAQALHDFGLEAEAVVKRAYSGGVLTDIRVKIGDEMGAVVTMWCGGTDGYECLDEAIGSLLERKDVRFAVAVCYPDDLASYSIERARYVWKEKPKVGAKSGLMSGGVADLALAISLVWGSPREPGSVASSLATSLAQDDRDMLTVALPHFTATGDARLGVRRRLLQDYWVHFIVASHDRRHTGFSENGLRPEVLVICKPRAASGVEAPITRTINLSRNPSTPDGARDVGSCIRKAVRSGTENVAGCGTVQEVEFRELEEGDWGAVHFLSPLLRKRFRQLRDCNKFRRIYLGAITNIGPTGRSVRDAFTPEPSIDADASEYKGLWGHGSNNVQTIRAKAETMILPKPGEQVSADGFWERRSRLLLPLQPHLPKARSMAVRLDEPTLGSMWTNCQIQAEPPGV